MASRLPRYAALLNVLLIISATLTVGEGLDSRRLLGSTSTDGGANGGVHSAIAFGTPAARKAFPYIVALFDSNGDWAGCGGTLVRPSLVVTAAHCVLDDAGKRTDIAAVKIGLLNMDTDQPSMYEFRRVTKVVPHSGYNRDTTANDIAVLLLDKPAKTKPAAMAPAGYKLVGSDQSANGDLLLVAGWGTIETGNVVAQLRFARVPYLSRAACNDIFVNELDSDAMPASHICAGYGTDKRDACEGDSGGPLVKRTSTGDVLVGVVSYGLDKCGGDANLGAYTSIAAMRSWINARITALKV